MIFRKHKAFTLLEILVALSIIAIIFTSASVLGKAQAVADTQVALTEGDLQHRIAEALPFDQMAKAHQIIEEGSVRGCVVVTI